MRWADIESSHLHAIEKDPHRSTGPGASQRGPLAARRGPFGTKQSTREAQWSACGDEGMHAKRTYAEEKSQLESVRRRTVRVWGLGLHFRGKGPSEG